MTFLKIKERPKEPKRPKRNREELLCPDEQLKRIAQYVRGMSEPEIIVTIQTLREMGYV